MITSPAAATTETADEIFILETMDALLGDGMPAGLGAVVAQRLAAGLEWARRCQPEDPDLMHGVRRRIEELTVIRETRPLNRSRRAAVTRQLLWEVDAAAEDPLHEPYGTVIWAAPRLTHLDQLREELAAAITEERGSAGADPRVITALQGDLLEVDDERVEISRRLLGSPGRPGAIIGEQKFVIWLKQVIEPHMSSPEWEFALDEERRELGWARDSLNAATAEMAARAQAYAAMPQPGRAEGLNDDDGDF